MQDNLKLTIAGHGYCHPPRRLLLGDNDILAPAMNVLTVLRKMLFNLNMFINFNRRTEISRPLGKLYAYTDVIKSTV